MAVVLYLFIEYPFILGDAVQFNASGLFYGATFDYML